MKCTVWASKSSPSAGKEKYQRMVCRSTKLDTVRVCHCCPPWRGAPRQPPHRLFDYHDSPTNALDLEAQLLKLGHDAFSLIALNLDPAILDRAASAAPLLELGGKFPQGIFVQRHVEHRGHALATPPRRFPSNFRCHRFLGSFRGLFRLCLRWSFTAASEETSQKVIDFALDERQGVGGIVNMPEF